MELTNTDKKRLVQITVVLAIGFGALYLFKPKQRKSMKANDESMLELPSTERVHMAPPVFDQDAGDNKKLNDAGAALTAYIQAYNEGVAQDELDALNKEFANEFGLNVIRRRSDNKLVVRDLNDMPVMIYPS